ncbi:MAG: ChbG/HpnK family deacetylase, partial [Betaproteobacteria bacterium]
MVGAATRGREGAAVKRVVLCVDDFGLHEGVNQAVAELVDAGVVSATSCMSFGPAWANGAALL